MAAVKPAGPDPMIRQRACSVCAVIMIGFLYWRMLQPQVNDLIAGVIFSWVNKEVVVVGLVRLVSRNIDQGTRLIFVDNVDLHGSQRVLVKQGDDVLQGAVFILGSQ